MLALFSISCGNIFSSQRRLVGDSERNSGLTAARNFRIRKRSAGHAHSPTWPQIYIFTPAAPTFKHVAPATMESVAMQVNEQGRTATHSCPTVFQTIVAGSKLESFQRLIVLLVTVFY